MDYYALASPDGMGRTYYVLLYMPRIIETRSTDVQRVVPRFPSTSMYRESKVSTYIST